MSRRDAHTGQPNADATANTAISGSVRDSLTLIVTDLSHRTLEKPALRDALKVVADWLASAQSDTAQSAVAGNANAQGTANSDVRGDAIRPRHSDVTDNDLALIAERCRLKAEGARWAVERDELLRDGADFSFDVRPGDQDVIGRARELPNCYLWMNQPRSDIWSRADNYLLLADCFETLAESIEAVVATTQLEERSHFMAGVDLMAEAQSALRTSVSRVESHPDSDQQMIYYWLRNRASQERFYISRFMKITDPADPERNDDVHDRAFELLEAIAPDQHLKTQIERGMAKAKHHVERIAQGDDVSDEYDWSRAAEAIESVVEFGVAADSEELVTLIEPYAEQLTDQAWPQGFQNVLAAIRQRPDDQSPPASERAA